MKLEDEIEIVKDYKRDLDLNGVASVCTNKLNTAIDTLITFTEKALGIATPEMINEMEEAYAPFGEMIAVYDAVGYQLKKEVENNEFNGT